MEKRIADWKELLAQGALDARLRVLYGEDVCAKKQRILDLLNTFAARFGEEREVGVFSVPGRSELAGNHTDHNNGRVIASSIDLDMICVAARRPDGVMCMESEGFDPIEVTPDMTKAPNEALFGTSTSLAAGMAHGFRENGLSVGGFDAVATSDVLRGSGLSSSAAYEDMIGTVLNYLYNEGRVDAVTVAKLAQKAENVFFGKPCGLMDQCACAVGGIIAIDFADPAAPVVEPVPFDLTAAGFALCIVDTGGNHADLTPDYAAVPAEMKAVAKELGCSVLRQADEAAVRSAIPALRAACGDRAVLRALHYFAENGRVADMKAALLRGDLEAYFAGVSASGRSSFCYLQNVYTPVNVAEQGLSLALCLCETLPTAAFRVHGGGFAGTVQAYVALSDVERFRSAMDAVFGEGACHVLHVRTVGATALSEDVR